MNVFKSSGERRLEAATWGALLVWVGISLATDMHKGVPSLVAGLILLVSAIAQRIAGWDAGVVMWAAGLALSISGLNDLTNGKHHLPAFAIILILIGGVIVLRAITGERVKQRHLTSVRWPPDNYRDV